jgi:hypothetical protein
METVNCVIAVPLVLIALFFVFTGWQRALRFNFHYYQDNDREKMRDNFFSSLNVVTGFLCIFPAIVSVSLWWFAIPFTLLMILVGTPLVMLGASWSSFLSMLMTGKRIGYTGAFWLGGKNLSTVEWYEYTPFAMIASWVVYFLVYVALLLLLQIEITSDVVPIWIVIVSLVFGVIAGLILTSIIHKKF